MPQSTKPIPQLNSFLRVVREEDAPSYDAVPSPKMAGGFAMIPARVFDLNDGTALAVFAVLAKHANQDGACWPSMKRLEECLGWTETRIRPALKQLIDAGLVAIEKRKLNGMDQSNLYRIVPEVRVPHHKVPVPHSKAMGTSPQGSGYLTTGDEQEPIELVNNVAASAAKSKKPLPQNGEAQKIVAAYCEAAGLEAPASYPKAVGQAKQMVDAGLTAADIPSLYEFAAEWKGTADLGLMLLAIDRWRAKPRATNGKNNMPPEIARLPWNHATRVVWESRNRPQPS